MSCCFEGFLLKSIIENMEHSYVPKEDRHVFTLGSHFKLRLNGLNLLLNGLRPFPSAAVHTCGLIFLWYSISGHVCYRRTCSYVYMLCPFPQVCIRHDLCGRGKAKYPTMHLTSARNSGSIIVSAIKYSTPSLFPRTLKVCVCLLSIEKWLK